MKRAGGIAALALLACLVGAGPAVSAGGEVLDAVVRIRAVFPEGVATAVLPGGERRGNGVVIDDEGTILTLSFLTRDADRIEVIVPGKPPIPAQLVGFDHETGFGLIRTERPLGIAPIMLGDSSSLEVGTRAIVAGSGGSDELILTQVVSRHEFAGSWEYLLEDAIFTSPSFADFSGASLIDSGGRLVGLGYLYTPMTLPGYGFIPCNLFIPIDRLKPILAELMRDGVSSAAKRPWLGVYAEEAHGRVFVTRVTAGGPAEKAGVGAGDMIVSVAGRQVRGLADLYRKVWALGLAGVEVPLAVLQGERIRPITILSGDRYKAWREKRGKELRL